MVEAKEITLEQFSKFVVKQPVSKTGKEAIRILGTLKPGKPVLLERVSRGMQVALSRRIKKNYPGVEMRVNKHRDKTRDIALLLIKK